MKTRQQSIVKATQILWNANGVNTEATEQAMVHWLTENDGLDHLAAALHFLRTSKVGLGKGKGTGSNPNKAEVGARHRTAKPRATKPATRTYTASIAAPPTGISAKEWVASLLFAGKVKPPTGLTAEEWAETLSMA